MQTGPRRLPCGQPALERSIETNIYIPKMNLMGVFSPSRFCDSFRLLFRRRVLHNRPQAGRGGSTNMLGAMMGESRWRALGAFQDSNLILNSYWDRSFSMSMKCAAEPSGSRFRSGGYTRGLEDIAEFYKSSDVNDNEKRDDEKLIDSSTNRLSTRRRKMDQITEEEAHDCPTGPSTGAFQKLPMVSPAHELIETAIKRSDRVGYNKKLKNDGARAKNRAARQLDTLMKELTGPLGKYEKGFIDVEKLHPFERALLKLSVGEDKYVNALDGVKSLRKSVVGVAKGYAGRCSKAPTKKEALDLRDEGFAKVDSTYKRQSYMLEELKEVAKSLRRLPVVDPDLPTVALVGAPNVGKSSLVQLLSSGLPEIQNYPFTTRSIKMGHFYVDSRRHQVTDTPGLLNRPDEDRNAMEQLTLASLEYLPTSVLFVIDLTGECGTSLVDQWMIRDELKTRFPDKAWIDVFSKADILQEEFSEADEISDTPVIADLISNKQMLASEFASLLRDAQRVSSLTGDGMEELKKRMVSMFTLGD